MLKTLFQNTHKYTMNLVGNLLIAPPAIKGTFWYKTVIMITEHHNLGSVGIVLNKRHQLTISDFGRQLGVELDYPGYVYHGGPVNSKSFSFLHSNDWACKHTLRISNKFSVSSADDILPRLAIGDQPDHWRIILGMSAWAPGQLLGEIKGTPPWNHNTSWCTASATLDLVFDSDNKDQWVAALDRSGHEFAQSILT